MDTEATVGAATGRLRHVNGNSPYMEQAVDLFEAALFSMTCHQGKFIKHRRHSHMLLFSVHNKREQNFEIPKDNGKRT